MLPVLIEVGDFRLHTYGAAGAAGFVLFSWLALRGANARGWDRDRVIDVIFWGALSGIVGARLLFILQNPGTLDSLFGLVDLRSGGMVFYGAFLGIPVALLVAWRGGLPLADSLDLFAPLLPLAHGMARLGCFGAGCCYGHESSVPWAVTFDHPLALAPLGVPLHPVQLYEAAGLFGLSWALARLAVRKRFGGEVILAYVGGYALLRLLTELFRGDVERLFVLEGLLGPVISTSQALATLFLVAVTALWVWRSRRMTAPTEA